MNDTRIKVEEFKRELQGNPSKKLMLGIDEFVPKTLNARLNFNHEYDKAIDLAIAKHLGIEIDDFDEFYKDRSKEEAEAWADELKDMPKQKISYRL